MMKPHPCALFLVLIAAGLTAANPAAAQEPTREQMLEQLSTVIRGLVEPGFQESNGFGFDTFACEVHTDLGPGSRFDCDAVDHEGDRIRYTLEVDDEGVATVVRASQPAGDLSAEDRAALEPPCRRFIDSYSKTAWNPLIADLHPAVLDTVSPDAIRAQLEPIRNALGEVRSATFVTYSRGASDRHELEYALDCANGPGRARFSVAVEAEGARITAFVVSPTPGSALHTQMLLNEGRDTIAGFLGVAVSKIEAPIQDLRFIGETVDGTATLADGRVLPIGVIQQGDTGDFDIIDYRFYVLDVPFLLMRAYASRPDVATSVKCPSRVAPDGGTLTCRVVFASGRESAVTVARRIGDHRIVDSQPIDE
jgi:hypothetical protein